MMVHAPFTKQVLSADGNSNGTILVAQAAAFVVNSTVYLSALDQPTKILEVVDILSPRLLAVRDPSVIGTVRFNSSSYTTANKATLVQPSQVVNTSIYRTTWDAINDVLQKTGETYNYGGIETVTITANTTGVTSQLPPGKYAVTIAGGSIFVKRNATNIGASEGTELVENTELYIMLKCAEDWSFRTASGTATVTWRNLSKV
jgi:hypothetical protein